MKHQLQITKVFISFFVLLSISGCEKDLYEDTIYNKNSNPNISKTFISKSQLLREIHNLGLKNLIDKVHPNTSINGRIEVDSLVFEKIVKENEYTTYNLKLKDYTEAEPFFKYLTITKDELEKIRAGYIKYTPVEAMTELNLKEFSGDIQVYKMDNQLIGETYFVEGNAQTTSRLECYDKYELIQHNCTGELHHSPGQPGCEAGDAYVEIFTTFHCANVEESESYQIGDLESGMQGGGGVSSANFNLLNQNLNSPQRSIFDNFFITTFFKEEAASYIPFNQDAINILKEKVNFIVNNGEIRPTVNNFIASYPDSERKPLILSYFYAKLLDKMTTENKDFHVSLLNNLYMNPVCFDPAFDYLMQRDFDDESKTFINQSSLQITNNPDIFTSIKPFLIEKNIDDSQLNPCEKGVLDDLKGLQQSDIANIFGKINNPVLVTKPNYKTKIILENPTLSGAYADASNTIIPYPNQPQPGQAYQLAFDYTIRVRPSYLDGTMLTSNPIKKPTKLSIARTLLHEIVHAYLFSLYDECYFNHNCTTIKQFPELWNDYVKNKLNNPDPSIIQHLTIAKDFTKILAIALQEYQTGDVVTNPDQDYIDLAWYGLQGNYPNPNPDILAQIFNLEYPLGSDKRDRFDKVNRAEDRQESSNSNGSITPKSTSCN